MEVSLRARQHQRNAEIERKQRHGSQLCYVIDGHPSRWRQIGFVSGDLSGYAKEAAKIQTDNEGNISFLLKSSRIPLNAGNTLWPIATTMVTRNPTVRAWREPPPNAAVRIGSRHVNTEGGRNKKPDIGGAHGGASLRRLLRPLENSQGDRGALSVAPGSAPRRSSYTRHPPVVKR